MPYFTNLKLAMSWSRLSCSLVRHFQKWCQNENNSKIEVAQKRQSFSKSLNKAKISKCPKCLKIEILLYKAALLSNISKFHAF